MSQQTKRVCLITGSSRTLGAEIAQVLESNGIEIAINYNKSENSAIDLSNKIKDSGIRAEIIRADVAEPKDAHKLVLKTLDLFGQIDILVNNAGPYVDDPYLELKLEDFDHIMQKYNLEKANTFTFDKFGKEINSKVISDLPKNLIENILKLTDDDPLTLMEIAEKYFIVQIVEVKNVQKEFNDETVKKDVLLNLKRKEILEISKKLRFYSFIR